MMCEFCTREATVMLPGSEHLGGIHVCGPNRHRQKPCGHPDLDVTVGVTATWAYCHACKKTLPYEIGRGVLA